MFGVTYPGAADVTLPSLFEAEPFRLRLPRRKAHSRSCQAEYVYTLLAVSSYPRIQACQVRTTASIDVGRGIGKGSGSDGYLHRITSDHFRRCLSMKSPTNPRHRQPSLSQQRKQSRSRVRRPVPLVTCMPKTSRIRTSKIRAQRETSQCLIKSPRTMSPPILCKTVA